ncbi:Replication protein A 14 kDa subunit B, partial [Mucuna pruriens]
MVWFGHFAIVIHLVKGKQNKEDSFFLPSIIVLCNMDTSNPAAFVNAELLHFYVGRRVRALMQVMRSDGGVVIGKSTDEKQLVVKGSPPPAPLTNFVEVIGIVNSDKSIGAEIWSNFGDAIGIVYEAVDSDVFFPLLADMISYNKLCQLANGEFKHLFLCQDTV